MNLQAREWESQKLSLSNQSILEKLQKSSLAKIGCFAVAPLIVVFNGRTAKLVDSCENLCACTNEWALN